MSFTVEQQAVLDELIAHLPGNKPVPAAPEVVSASPDLLQGLLGVSKADLMSQFTKLLAQKNGLECRLLDWVERQPFEAVFEFLLASSMAFYLAEKEANPKIKTYTDSFYYISTCASVGFADIFAATQTGKAIASLVMTVGPSLTAKALNRPEPQPGK